MGGITGFHLCMALVLPSLVYHRERLHSDIMDSTYDSELQAGHPLSDTALQLHANHCSLKLEKQEIYNPYLFFFQCGYKN